MQQKDTLNLSLTMGRQSVRAVSCRLYGTRMEMWSASDRFLSMVLEPTGLYQLVAGTIFKNKLFLSGARKKTMKEIGSTSRKISPGSERGLLKRVEKDTGIRYSTLKAWDTRGLLRSTYPVRLLWAVLDVLTDDENLSVLERARKRI